MRTVTRQCIVLGAGLAGMAAAMDLEDSAVVLEKELRAGGLTRTECFNGFWFDHVLHLIYFHDQRTEKRIRGIMGTTLAPCRAESWVETARGAVRFPFQMHLGGLDRESIVRCLNDLADVTFSPKVKKPENFEEMLLGTFGTEMCEIFLFPYNRKVWKRSLATLAPSGFQWTITPPDFKDVLRGALDCDRLYPAYNSNGWYPRVPAGAPLRGIELLSEALASRLPHLYLGHKVVELDPVMRVVYADHRGERRAFEFQDYCVSTLPLPQLMNMCKGVPSDLQQACSQLTHNRVLTIAFSIRGPRPKGRGHWRYYGDESIVFTRLVYMHEFDPRTAPADGWALMAEITEPAESPVQPESEIISRARADLEKVEALPLDCEVVDAHLLKIDPAYVVFTPENRQTVDRCVKFLTDLRIIPLGRYGRWEYSSAARVMRDGFACAENIVRERLLRKNLVVEDVASVSN